MSAPTVGAAAAGQDVTVSPVAWLSEGGAETEPRRDRWCERLGTPGTGMFRMKLVVK